MITEQEAQKKFGVNQYWLGKLFEYGYLPGEVMPSFDKLSNEDIKKAILAVQKDFGIQSAWGSPARGTDVTDAGPHMRQIAPGRTNAYEGIENLDKLERLYQAYASADGKAKYRAESALNEQIKTVLNAFPSLTLETINQRLESAGAANIRGVAKDLRHISSVSLEVDSDNIILTENLPSPVTPTVEKSTHNNRDKPVNSIC